MFRVKPGLGFDVSLSLSQALAWVADPRWPPRTVLTVITYLTHLSLLRRSNIFIGPTRKNHRRSEGATCTSSGSLQVHSAPLERHFFRLRKL